MIPLLIQLLIGTSISLYDPPIGTCHYNWIAIRSKNTNPFASKKRLYNFMKEIKERTQKKKMKVTVNALSLMKVGLTAGLARLLVRGKSLVPAPPPSIIATVVLGSLFSMSKSLNCIQSNHIKFTFSGTMSI